MTEALDGLQPRLRGRRGAALLRRLRRARRADPPGREAGRLRRGQHQAAARSCTTRACSRSRSSSPPTSSCSRCRRDSDDRARSTTCARTGVKIAIGSESVPIGSYTREVLGRLPPGAGQAILGNVRSNEPDVKGIVGKLTQGAADAGFVYVTDVNAAGERLRAIELPARARGPRSPTAPAVVEGAEQPRGRARVRRRRCTSGRVRRRAARRPGFGPRRVSAVPASLLLARAWPRRSPSSPCRWSRSSSRLEPGRADRQPRRAGRARRALAEPAQTTAIAHRRSSSWSARRPPTCWPRARSAARRSWSRCRAAARAAAGGGGHRAARRGRARGHPRRRGRGGGHRAGAPDRGRGGGAHLRRVAVLRAPGDGRVRGGRPHAARRLAHARRLRGARLRARDDPGRAARPRRRPRAGARAARSGSSARR